MSMTEWFCKLWTSNVSSKQPMQVAESGNECFRCPLVVLLFFYLPYLCSRGSLKNWKYKIQVGTTINLCDQRPADSRAAKWR